MKATFIIVGVLVVAAVAWFTLSPRSANNLLVEQAVALQIDNGAIGVFLTVVNQGIPDRLLSVDSELGDVSIINPAASGDLPIPIGRASLAADAAYIMIAAGETSHEIGELLPVTLSFQNAGDIQVKALMSDPMAQEQAGMAHMGDMGHMDLGSPIPSVEIVATADETGWKIQITTEDFIFTEEQMGMPHKTGMGHAHIYVGGMKLGRVFGDDYRIGQLPSGTHEIRVTLNTNDHRAYKGSDGDVTAVTVIEVD